MSIEKSPDVDDLRSRRSRGSSWFEAIATSAGISSLAGMIAGLVWGGIGGRVAMRVLFLTSDERVKGITSDDGFEIGTISLSTIFLLIFTVILGSLAGLLVGLLRMVTSGPAWLVAIGVGCAAAAGGGASIVNTDGIDFVFLDPLWLAVGLFVLIPGLWGVSAVWLFQRLTRPGALFPSLPERLGERRWGMAGWLVLGAITVAGVLDLVSDIAELS